MYVVGKKLNGGASVVFQKTKQKEYINNWVDQRSTLVPEST